MIDSVPGVDPARKARLIAALDIDPAWRMHQVGLQHGPVRAPVRAFNAY